MSAITQNQLCLLNSLTCERLASREDHRQLIMTVSNANNRNLVADLQSAAAWERDQSGTTDYYLVKAPTGEILLFFSLRCGEVFENIDQESIQLAFKIKAAETMLLDLSASEEERQEARNFILGLTQQGIAIDNVDDLIKKWQLYMADQKGEPNKEVQRVFNIYSSVELCLLCVNDVSRALWKSYGLPQKMGLCVFWHIIVPKLEALKDIAGCEYIHLFAADDNPEGTLVNYYKVMMHFDSPLGIGVNKPTFDYNCYFLCQKINDLLKWRDHFYAHFNIDTEQAV